MHKPKEPVYQLADYIIKNLSKGYTLDALKYALITQGYSKISVSNAIEFANKQLAVKAPSMKEKPQITYKILDEKNNPVEVIKISENSKKSFWKRLFG